MPYAVTGTRKDAVLRQLRDEIVRSELTPGTVLKDAEVAARLGVSITPVREAIGQLAAEGLIATAPNRTRHVAHVTRENALELIDVMRVLACAGFEWGVSRLTEPQLTLMRLKFEEFEARLGRGDLTGAAVVGADFSTIVVLASGNHELQTHLDLVVTRSLRVQALTGSARIWRIWLEGYRETLALLEAREHAGAVSRYRRIYTEYRECVESALSA